MRRYFVAIASVLLLFITGFYIVNFPFGGTLYKVVSGATLMLSAFVVYYFLYKYAGIRKSLPIIIGLSFYGVIIESIGVSTGLPYGGFEYTSVIGFKLFELIPWNVFFVWAPLVIGSVAIGKFVSKNSLSIILISTIILLIYDFLFDPIAVELGFWIWDNPGLYYGIPISNFMGWIFSGAISSAFTLYFLKELDFDKVSTRNLTIGLFSSFLMWSTVAFWLHLYIPMLLGILLTVVIFYYLYSNGRVD